LLLVFGVFGPPAGGKGVGGGHADSVAVSFGFIEEVVFSVAVNNVAVDA
jgi:hypothetical protein